MSHDQVERKIRKKLNKPRLMDPEVRDLVLPILSKVQKRGIEGGIDTSRGIFLPHKCFNSNIF
jgi:hypothetical protein